MTVSAHKLQGKTAWLLTDGKIGDRVQCLGVANRLGVSVVEKTILPGPPWEWFMPAGPIPPGHRPSVPTSPIAPPFPDLVIASGRRLVAYLRAIRKASAGRTFTVFLKDPRHGTSDADLIWVPAHDRLRGENVIVTDTAPHRLTREGLDQALQSQDWPFMQLPSPRLALILGDPLSRASNRQTALATFLDAVRQALPAVGSVAVVTSRRTPEDLIGAVRTLLADVPHWIWTGEGENPYQALLAGADYLAVTADSHNMVGEALFTGKPVFTIRPEGINPKLEHFLESLTKKELVRSLSGKIEPYSYEPVDATVAIAAEIERAFSDRS
ncbi:nucleoside-diphosphate sugar epimerase [Martelella alba]|uniref:Nucleoside-diphosphate sugar epimerase n=1 Tax=Martelella alba TaxID=2590451 RepID=A0A506UII0_9HYPH|nr:mitochondrial fission ELM1 family protein [Martelella alba]TPW33102.1 nucleoside-diphosphate sugar epimerase [Martelella alba]